MASYVELTLNYAPLELKNLNLFVILP
jgi:hypothetical protein